MLGLLEYCWTPSRSTRAGPITVLSSAKSIRGSFREASEKALLKGLLTVYPNHTFGFSEHHPPPPLRLWGTEHWQKPIVIAILHDTQRGWSLPLNQLRPEGRNRRGETFKLKTVTSLNKEARLPKFHFP